MKYTNFRLVGNEFVFPKLNGALISLSQISAIDTYSGGGGVFSITSDILNSEATYNRAEGMVSITGEGIGDLKQIIEDEINRRQLDITLKPV